MGHAEKVCPSICMCFLKKKEGRRKKEVVMGDWFGNLQQGLLYGTK